MGPTPNNKTLQLDGFTISDSILLLLPFLTSDVHLSHGALQGDVFCWIEILSAVNTPMLKAFTTRVADCWLAIKLKVSRLHNGCLFRQRPYH